MTGVLFVATCLGAGILLLATLGLIIIGIIRAAKTGGISQKEKDAHAKETKMIQDMFNALSKMEARVEALETILLEHRRKDL